MTENDKFLVRFAQCLASNEKKYRDRAVVKLKKWLQTKCKGDMLDEQLMKIWKGLHYCMWMSDKPLVQEELADRLSKLVHVMETPELTLRFVESFFWTEAREWHGTDVFRLDKFMMLIRLYWRESLMFLKQNSWEMSSSLIDLLSRTYISVEEDRVSDGLRFFMADIFWEELERVGAEELSQEQVAAFMRPYCVVICKTENKMLQQHVMKNIFEPPLEWAKEDLALDEFLGDEEEEAEEDEEEEEEEEEIDEDNEVDEEEEGETEELEEIHRCAVDLQMIADQLFEMAADPKQTIGRNRDPVYKLVKRYQAAAKGEFEAEKPLSKSRHAIVRSGQVNDAVERLTRFENKLKEDERKRKMEEKKEYLKKKAKGREMEDEDEEDEAPAKKKRKRKHKKKQVEEEKEIETPKKKEKLSQKKSPILKNSKSSDSENETPNRKKKAKKVESTPVAKSHTDSEGESPKKKKKKTLTNGNVLSPIEKSPKELAPVKKVQRRKSLESGLLSSTKSDKKNERKSLDQTEAPANETILENGEIEIYIPRKPKTKKQSPKRDNFASFDSGKTPPPAFVKKAVAKTEPKKKAKKLLKADDLDTPTGNKRVSFIMARNTAQEFEDSFTEPKPFNPFVLPDTGILKPSPANSPAITPKRNMVKRRRSTAADFF